MAAITAASVTVAPYGAGGGVGRSVAPGVEDSSLRLKTLVVSFGNGTLTYPAGGIPLAAGLKANGFPYEVNVVEFVDSSAGDGYVYKYSRSTQTLRIYGANAAAGVGPLTEMATTFAPAATTVTIRVYGH